MAFRCIKLLRIIRRTNLVCHNAWSTSAVFPQESFRKAKQFKTEGNLTYLEDPDTFGTLSRRVISHTNELQDEGDIKEEKYTKERPLPSQKLTTRQYADIIKQFIKHKRLKEAIDVLEVRMLQEDRVKPENYIFNILIGACADVGYTKKAFKLYNDMKRRALKPTGDTYTCLFHACANSPWPLDGLKYAKNLRELMFEKGIEPNLTNYNSMIKAFGRCGDLPTAFKIVDQMLSKKIKIRVHTFNHLLQACISDKQNGLRHALIVWRKMMKMREKPNIYSFNLMLKCIKDCNLGSKEDIEELIGFIQEQIARENSNRKNQQIASPSLNSTLENIKSPIYLPHSPHQTGTDLSDKKHIIEGVEEKQSILTGNAYSEISKEVAVIENNKIKFEVLQKVKTLDRVVPNLLSKSLQLQHVMSLQAVQSVQDKFAVIGGQEDFLKEMEAYSVKPDIKIFSQMIPLLEETREAENQLLVTMKSLEVKADIDFYNILIKKRCMRKDYDGAFDVKDIIEMENKSRKKRHPMKKKLRLTPNIMTFGVLAMACKTQESADKLLNEMKEKQIKVNIEILGSLLRQGIAHSKFGYVLHIMKIAKEENIPISPIFLKHLENFNEKCTSLIKQGENGKRNSTVFIKAFEKFSYGYKTWLKEANIEQALTPEHPWKQFREEYPETVQRTNVKIEQPKKFYKGNRKYVPYVASAK